MPLDAPISQIRLLTEKDIPWALDLAEKCYRRKLDKDLWTENLKTGLENPSIKIIRGDDSVVVCEAYYPVPGSSEVHGRFLYWFHRGNNPRELVRCFEAAISLMGRSGVQEIYLCPAQGSPADTLPHTLGFHGTHPTFFMKVGHA